MMPLLKGLVGDEAPEEGATGMDDEFVLTVDDLTAEELEDLQVEAEQAAASGALDSVESEGGEEEEYEEGATGPSEGAETAADEAMESPEEQAAEDEAGTELHSTTDFVEQAKAGYDECSTLCDQLKAAIKELEEDEDAKDLLETAEEDLDSAKEIADEAEDALDDDDIQAASDAAARVAEIKQAISDALSQVASMKADEDAAKAAEEAPEEGAAGCAPTGAPVATKPGLAKPVVAAPKRGMNDHPLSMWAKRSMHHRGM